MRTKTPAEEFAESERAWELEDARDGMPPTVGGPRRRPEPITDVDIRYVLDAMDAADIDGATVDKAHRLMRAGMAAQWHAQDMIESWTRKDRCRAHCAVVRGAVSAGRLDDALAALADMESDLRDRTRGSYRG